jgi:hypothetical protein
VTRPPTARAPLPTHPAAPPVARRIAGLTLVAAIVGLGAVTALLWWSGNALPPPTTLDERGVAEWLGTTDPVVAAFALVRLAGLAAAAWIAMTGTASLLVHLSRLRRIRWLRRLVDRLCLPVVRRLVHGVAGVTLAAATLAPGAAGAVTAPTPPARVETAFLVAVEGPNGAREPVPTADRARIVSLDPAPTAPAPAAPTPASPASAPPPSPAPAAGETWEIRRGDHLWHVAEATLARRHGTAPTDAETAGYLAVLHQANRDRLLVPDDPDLVVAGQVMTLPPTTHPGPG